LPRAWKNELTPIFAKAALPRAWKKELTPILLLIIE
jgi:hypothetical protein